MIMGGERVRDYREMQKGEVTSVNMVNLGGHGDWDKVMVYMLILECEQKVVGKS